MRGHTARSPWPWPIVGHLERGMAASSQSDSASSGAQNGLQLAAVIPSASSHWNPYLVPGPSPALEDLELNKVGMVPDVWAQWQK